MMTISISAKLKKTVISVEDKTLPWRDVSRYSTIVLRPKIPLIIENAKIDTSNMLRYAVIDTDGKRYTAYLDHVDIHGIE